MTNNYLIRTIYPANENAFMPFDVLTNLVSNPTTAKIASFSTPANRLIILMPNVVNGQTPILILQNSPIQTQTLRKGTVHSLNRYQPKSPQLSIQITIRMLLYPLHKSRILFILLIHLTLKSPIMRTFETPSHDSKLCVFTIRTENVRQKRAG
ncbi:MAG: hypothetical protein ABSD73_01390 [Candidatus Bathyarchaeia archaeon]